MNVKSHIDKLKKYIEDNNFKGYDPYDALNSPILRALAFDSKILRILFIQALKKFPINLRPILGVPVGRNPKALGLFLWGYAKGYRVERHTDDLTIISRLLDLLDETRSPGYSGNCWGYNFDWQSRAFFVPKYTPTIVNSAFIGHALIDTYRITGMGRALEMALSIGDFIVRDLNRSVEKKGLCFSYTPLDRSKIHNANLLGASLLIRSYRFSGQDRHREIALSCLDYSMHHQRPDGSWYYAETEYQKWIDEHYH